MQNLRKIEDENNPLIRDNRRKYASSTEDSSKELKYGKWRQDMIKACFQWIGFLSNVDKNLHTRLVGIYNAFDQVSDVSGSDGHVTNLSSFGSLCMSFYDEGEIAIANTDSYMADYYSNAATHRLKGLIESADAYLQACGFIYQPQWKAYTQNKRVNS